MTNKGGRPRVSNLGIIYSDKKDYNRQYTKGYRYVFSTNLSQDKDRDIIETIETLCNGNRQKAVKILLRAGIKHLYDD